MRWDFELILKPSPIPLTEGPVWDGELVFFTHIRASLIYRYNPRDGVVSQWRSGTNKTNGLAFDAAGALYGCCSGGRSIVRFAADGSEQTVVADQLDGKRLNTPNDLAIDRQGRIWFSDPWNAEGNLPAGAQEELGHRSILCADPRADGSYVVRRATFDTVKPNGVLLSQDQRVLYVAESGFDPAVVRELRAYPIREDGTLGPFTTLTTWGSDYRGVHRGIDGMCLDVEGNIVACTGWNVSGPGPLIQVISPYGRTLETHPVPALMPTNCCFGGADMTTLFVTTLQGHFFQVKTHRKGWAMYP
jgi:gluconolactonase